MTAITALGQNQGPGIYTSQAIIKYRKYHLQHLVQLKQLEASHVDDNNNAETYIEKSRFMLQWLEKYYGNSDYYELRPVYGRQMDSLKEAVILSSSKAIALNPSAKIKIIALKDLGYVYFNDNDSIYTGKVVNALDTLGYKYPAFFGGVILGAGFGKSYNTEINAAFGYWRPGNKLVRERPNYHAFTVGYEIDPRRNLGGFKVGVMGSYYPFMAGVSAIFFGDEKGINPVTGNSQSYSTGTGFRPEVGFIYGQATIAFGYTFFSKNKYASGGLLERLNSQYNSAQVSVRFLVFKKIEPKSLPFKGRQVMAGFIRRR